MTEKTLFNADVSGAKVNVPDLIVVGNGDLFQLLCKASSQREGWLKSTKAMEVPGGCVVQVAAQQRNPDGSSTVAEGRYVCSSWLSLKIATAGENSFRTLVSQSQKA